MAVGYASYTALYSYKPQEPDDVELREGDVILVRKPVPADTEWFEGVNQRTKQCGQIPGNYLKKIADFPGSLQLNGHDFQMLSKIFPVCCVECKDYIWGKNGKVYECSLCCQNYHQLCAKDCAMCNSVANNGNDDSAYDTLAKSPSDWTVEDVVCWMAVTNLFQYANIFIQYNVVGRTLINFDETRLVSMGIYDEFHQKMILACIGELIGNSEKKKPRKSPGMQIGQKGSINSHSFVLQTFTTMTWCHECGYILFGLVRQGLQCRKCELIVHRKCTNYQVLRVCPQKAVREPTDPLYVPPLENNSIPAVVKKCVSAVESRGLRTRGIYKDQLENFASKYALRAALYKDAEYVDMKDEEWINPLCPSTVLLSYFNELPDSVVPSDLYDEIMTIPGRPDGQIMVDIDKMFEKVPDCNTAVLDYLLEHLNRVVSSDNNMSEKDMADIFGLVLMRPSQEHLIKMAKNIAVHSKISQHLMARSKRKTLDASAQDDDDGEASVMTPPVPPRLRNAGSIETHPSRPVDEAEWYWGRLNSHEVQKKMEDWRDGSFLVRDSNRHHGEHTLILKKNGENKLIRIIHSKGKYGFEKDLQISFNSIPDLVDYYRTHSLKDYNPLLDTVLLYPVSREDISGVKKATTILKNAGKLFNEKSLRYEQLSERTVTCEQDMSALEEAIFAQKELINFLGEQGKIHQNFQREVSPRDKEMLELNYNVVAGRLAEEHRNLSHLESDLQEKSEMRRGLEADMNHIRPDLWELLHTKEKYMKLLEDKEVMTREEVELIAGNIDFKIYELPMTEEEEQINLSEEKWLFGLLDRKTAEQYLNTRRDGTFLIRESSNKANPGLKVVSVVFNKVVRHCVIVEGQEGYGFAEGFKTHKTLTNLVQYYHRVSLQMHNNGLATTLRFPVRSNPDIP